MEEAEALVLRIVAGELTAWPLLQRELAPTLTAFARSHLALRKRGLASADDHVAEVVGRTLAALAANEFKNLKRYRQRLLDASTRAERFDAWLYGALDFVIRRYLRELYGRAPKVGDAGAVRPSRRDLNSLAGRLDDESPRALLHTLQVTQKVTVAQIFAFAREHFAAEEVKALELFYRQDRSFEELAAELGLSTASEADRLIRRLNARLRYKFGGEQT